MNSVLSVIALAAGISIAAPAVADGRSDWKDYAWQSVVYADCPDNDETGLCQPFHQKWDWKRNQWVDFLYKADAQTGALKVRLRLTNDDQRDDDNVCVTALFVDDKGADVFAFHQNWHVKPGQVLDKTLTFSTDPTVWRKAAKVLIGSKQCRKGADQDDALFAGVKHAIGQPD